ncbi:ABC transporter ATP-binding protein [Virgisporangium aurantiacum]|uniref:ABC transporter ATP-binding protein n=1 Tax=Virgisporangium aurantiacum TaxID=175570 RepID=UPI001952708A|nr:ABC transporter ATP-binding protein [Virgisporangium aurantiacum]
MRRLTGVWVLAFRAGPWLAAGQLAIAVTLGLLPAAVAWLTKFIIDGLATGKSAPALLGWSVGLAAAGLATAAAPQLTTYLGTEQRRRLDRLMQDRLYTAVNSFQGLSRFESPRFLDTLRMASQATGGALAPVTTGVLDVGRAVITALSLTATLFVLSPVMTGIVLAAAIPALVAQILLSKKRLSMIVSLSPAVRRQIFYGRLITDLQAVKEIRLFGLGDFFKTRVLAELCAVQAGERDIDRRVLRVQFLLAALSATVTGGGLIWAVRTAANGGLSPGDVTAFVAAVAGVQAALSTLVTGIAQGYQALLMFDHFAEATSQPPDLPCAPPGALAPLRRGIEFRDVWFRYDPAHAWVLQGLDLTLPYGRSVALVGLNGAGKSTLVKLLCRLYDPDRGAIHWDGVDIRTVAPAELRRRIGVLFQDFMAYDLTAAENVGLGDLDGFADRSRIEHAARTADVHDAIEATARGYDTLLSRMFFKESDKDNPETGVMLSGGQWQRLALARTLMRDRCDLLILDEPSAGLDAEAEHQIHQRLRDHRHGRTSLLISHRLGAVRDADLIVVLADGRIVEKGGHAELMSASGAYARLFTLQAAGYRHPEKV